MRCVVVAAALFALLVGGCGSASPPARLPGLAPLPADSSPTAIVRYALESLTRSAYDAMAHNVEAFSYPGVAPSLAGTFRARMAQGAGITTISAEVTDLRNFRMEMTIGATRLTVRARNGTYQASRDGGSPQQIPASEANALFTAIQGNAGTLAEEVVVRRTLRPGVIDGIRVVRYLVAVSGSAQDRAVSPILSAAGASLPSNALQAGPAIGIMAINPRTHAPVQIVLQSTGAVRLTALHPGDAGEISYTATSTDTYSHVVPHPR